MIERRGEQRCSQAGGARLEFVVQGKQGEGQGAKEEQAAGRMEDEEEQQQQQELHHHRASLSCKLRNLVALLLARRKGECHSSVCP